MSARRYISWKIDLMNKLEISCGSEDVWAVDATGVSSVSNLCVTVLIISENVLSSLLQFS